MWMTDSAFELALRWSTEDEDPGGDDISDDDLPSESRVFFLRVKPLRSFPRESLAKHRSPQVLSEKVTSIISRDAHDGPETERPLAPSSVFRLNAT